MGIDLITLAVSKAYTKESLLGGGAIVGKNVQVAKIEPIIGGNRVTFSYTLDDGTTKTSAMEVMNGEQGVSVVSANVEKNFLYLTLSNGEIIPAGEIVIDSSQLDLDNYYTINESNEKFVNRLELTDLINKHLDETFVPVSSDEIKQLYNII